MADFWMSDLGAVFAVNGFPSWALSSILSLNPFSSAATTIKKSDILHQTSSKRSDERYRSPLSQIIATITPDSSSFDNSTAA
ncbi:hypothetical protein BH11BAC3_BH11BAC3_22610 [soil metagenome]